MTSARRWLPSLGAGRTALLAQAAAMAALAILGALLISAKDLTLDELATLDYASRPLPDMLAVLTQRQANMAIYTLLMAPWVAIRDTELWLRLPSLAAAVLTIPLLYRLALRLVGQRAAVFTIVLYAVTAGVVQQSQNARAYTLAILVGVAATLAFLRAWEAPTRGRVLTYAALVVVGAYVHFLLGFVAIAHAVSALLSGDHERTRRMAPAAVVIAVGVMPLAFFIVLGDRGQIDWVPPLSPESLGYSLYATAGGSVPAAAAWIIGLAIGLALLRRLGAWQRNVLLSWLLIPAALLVLVSIGKPLTAPRYFVPSIPAAVLLIGFGLSKMRARPGLVALTVVVAASLTGVAAWYGSASTRWADATHYVVIAARGRDRILYQVPYAQRAFDYYARRFGVPKRLPEPVGLDEVDDLDVPKLWVAVHLLTEEERFALARQLAPSWVLFRSFGYEGLSLRQYVPREGP